MTKEIGTPDKFATCARVISESFGTVAEQLGLTPENCPSNAAFTKIIDLQSMQESGVRMFGPFDENDLIEFIALKKAKKAVFYLEKLAPRFRHRGYGCTLLDFSREYVTKENGDKISIGIADENSVLKV